MFEVNVDITKKDYVNCNLYYLKRFFGAKEIILVSVLFVVGMVMFFVFQNLIMLILCGVAVGLVVATLAFYAGTSLAGYKLEFEKRGATRWHISFNELGFAVDTYERGGEEKFSEKRLFADIDRVAIRKDRVFIYASSAVMYYIKHDSFEKGNFVEFVEFIKEHVDSVKFKMKGKPARQFPYRR